MSTPGKPLKIFYATAAGDAVSSFRQWLQGGQLQSETAMTYTGEFFDLCTDLDASFLVVSPTTQDSSVTQGKGTVKNLRRQNRGSGGRYYLSVSRTSLALLREMARFQPDVAIVSDRVAFWLALVPARLTGTKLMLSVHVRLWPEQDRPHKRVHRALLRTERWFLRAHCAGALAVSPAVGAQIEALAGDRAPPIGVFRPLWRSAGFDTLAPPVWGRQPFRILFIGRVESNKGVLDLARAVDWLRRELDTPVHVDVCGDGGALPQLRQEIIALGLQDVMILHGQCARGDVLARLGDSHVVVVPTRSDFVEGYNKVAVEAVLARRPVITSRICPALEDIRPAAIEVEPDDWLGYAKALRSLATDEALYAEKVAGAERIRDGFFDRSRGWKNQARQLFEKAGLVDPV